MILKQIILSDFRNHKQKKIDFSSPLSIIIGPNGSGKTNILESIFLLSLGKSFKADKSTDVISFGKDISRVKGNINLSNNRINDKIRQVNFGSLGQVSQNISEFESENTDEEIKLEAVFTRGEVDRIKTPMKKFLVNGVVKRMIDFAGKLKVVLFWPQDLELVTDSPNLRRKYLDYVLIQTDREYRRTLSSYERGIRQRNRLLEAIRKKGASRHQLVFWDQLLIKNGDYISRKREEYINYINKIPNSKFQIPNINYVILYDKSIISRQRLDQYSEQEIAAGVTLVGPHRDDVIFEIRNSKFEIRKENEFRNLSSFGSRGEQRLAVLWLKLSELSYIEKTTSQKPILLLDDILSEFDHDHRRVIFDLISDVQTIITTTDMHFLPKSIAATAEMIELADNKEHKT